MTLEDVKKLNIPSSAGCYQYFNQAGEIIYVGKAINLFNRVLSYWQKSTQHTSMKASMMKQIEKIEWIEVDTEIEAFLLEANLIKKHQPYYNIMLRDDKRFSYVKIDLEAEIPSLSVVRTIDKSGKYFGPFVSTTAVREVLKVIRKIWPYCTAKKISTTPCFYYQINRCLGICANKIDRAEYLKKVINPIILFFEGHKKTIIADIKKELKNITDEILKQKLNQRIKFFNHVLESAKILSVGEKYTNDVIELAKVLNLEKTPTRIEGYDISNIFGENAVGSMVVFSDGELNTAEYKKFKIKLDATDLKQQHGDVQMLTEMLERRFEHLEWPLPDLILVDGGKAQLNAAVKILKKNKLNIEILGLSKGEGLRSSVAPDKIFFPGEKKPLELSLNSPALHLLKRVRDEAHRFAIKYHRELRQKNWRQSRMIT